MTRELLRRARRARGRRARIRDLPPRGAAVEVRRGAAALLAEGAAREPAAQRGRRRRAARGHRGARDLGRERRAVQGDRLHARARDPAGLHGRPVRRRPRRAARRDGRHGRRPGADQPARAGRAGDRPLRPGRRVRLAAGVPDQRREGVRAQRRALRVPALGPDGVRGLQGGAAGHGHRPPGQPRVPRARGVRERGRALPRHARRDRLAHDDDQRPGRARLGRRRDRGRGGDARPADVDADPARGRLQARRRAARGRDRDRPRADRHREAARARRRRPVRRVLRRRASRNLPLADRATIGNMSPEFGSTCAIFPIDAETLRYLEFSGRSPEHVERVETYARAQGLWHDARRRGGRPTPRRSSSTSARSSRRSPARSARRTASR